MKTKYTKPLAGYPRVSRQGPREDDRFRSPDFQCELIRRCAETEGAPLRMFPAEIDVSGSKPERKILDEIIGLIEAGVLGGIIVAKLDRLSRLKPRDRIELFDRIESAGGVVLSASEQLDPSTPEGRFARDVFLGVARMQWEKYEQGWEKAKANAIELGIPVNSRPAVGYRARADRRLEPDPRTAPVVREVFERRAQGDGPQALGDFLKRSHVKTSQGSRDWTKEAVYNLLRNRVYLGELAYGRDVDPETGKRRPRYLNPTAHEPIVDLALWSAAQGPKAKLSKPRSPSAAWLLSGVLRCCGCGYSMQGTTTSRGKRIYRCKRTHAGGVCPQPVRIDADLIEAEVLAAFWQNREAFEARGTRERPDDRNLLKLQAALVKSQKRFEQWTSPAVQDEIGDTPEWAKGLRERREARDTDAKALGYAQAQVKHKADDELPSLATLREDWDDMTTEAQRELLARVFDLVGVTVEHLIVAFESGTGPSDLPTRGFRSEPRLCPIAIPDAPDVAGTLAA
jgi:DNA invertase Pin-like site-specific DNA recombinase